MSPNENKPNTVPTACRMWELSSGMLKEAYELSLSHKRKPVLLVTSRCSRSFVVHSVTKRSGKKEIIFAA